MAVENNEHRDVVVVTAVVFHNDNVTTGSCDTNDGVVRRAEALIPKHRFVVVVTAAGRMEE